MSTRPRRSPGSFLSLVLILAEVPLILGVILPGLAIWLRCTLIGLWLAVVAVTARPVIVGADCIKTRYFVAPVRRVIRKEDVVGLRRAGGGEHWVPRGHYGVVLDLLGGREVPIVETSTMSLEKAERWFVALSKELTLQGFAVPHARELA